MSTTSTNNNSSEVKKDQRKMMIELEMMSRRDFESEVSHRVCSERIAGFEDEQDHHGNEESRSTKEEEEDDDDDKEEEDENYYKELCHGGGVVAAKGRGLGELEVGDGDDEGFRTPTSLDHKIKEGSKCPPAPRKPKSLPLSKKRKLPQSLLSSWSSNKLHHVRIDLAEEIELLFPPAVVADLGRKVKKVRGNNDSMP